MTAIAGTSGSIVPPVGRSRPASAGGHKGREKRRAVHDIYINRELSWLEYSARVLHEAADPRNPVLERVRFLTIFAGMLDEQRQHVDRLAIQLDSEPVLAQLACSEVELESRKAGNPARDAGFRSVGGGRA